MSTLILNRIKTNGCKFVGSILVHCMNFHDLGMVVIRGIDQE
jgi:hypothetical protein